MAHMRAAIEEAEVYSVETTHGTENVRVEIVGDIQDEKLLRETLSECLEGQMYPGVEIERRKGFLAYLHAPGYLDRTDETFFDTEKEAAQFLLDYYYDQPLDEITDKEVIQDMNFLAEIADDKKTLQEIDEWYSKFEQTSK